MLHLGKMQFETALFFETVEEIYARVFRSLHPRAKVPPISVRFCRYANANSKIRLTSTGLHVRISDLLQSAPAPIQEALAWILLGKLFRRGADECFVARYRHYLNQAEIRQQLQAVRRERGRKKVLPACGNHFDLQQVFDNVNRRYFGDKLAETRVGWSRRCSRSVLGHYDPAHDMIVISKLLDDPRVPDFLVDYIMFHEMLHIQHPTEHKGLRRCIHTKQFKESEREFERYAEARRSLKDFSGILGGSSRQS